MSAASSTIFGPVLSGPIDLVLLRLSISLSTCCSQVNSLINVPVDQNKLLQYFLYPTISSTAIEIFIQFRIDG